MVEPLSPSHHCHERRADIHWTFTTRMRSHSPQPMQSVVLDALTLPQTSLLLGMPARVAKTVSVLRESGRPRASVKSLLQARNVYDRPVFSGSYHWRTTSADESSLTSCVRQRIRPHCSRTHHRCDSRCSRCWSTRFRDERSCYSSCSHSRRLRLRS